MVSSFFLRTGAAIIEAGIVVTTVDIVEIVEIDSLIVATVVVIDIGVEVVITAIEIGSSIE